MTDLPVDTLLQFNKLATLTGGNKVKVVEAASASSMLQVSEDHASIKRVKPLPQDDSNSMAVIERTVYLVRLALRIVLVVDLFDRN